MKKLFVLLLLAAAGWGIYDYQIGTPGERIYDRVFAKKALLDFDALEPSDTVDKIRQDYRGLHHTCTGDNSKFGDYVCWSPIKTLNGVDARVLAFFFRQGKLSAVRVSFSGKNHPEIFALLSKKYGEYHTFGRNRDAYGNNIVGWIRPNGIVAVNDEIDPKDEAILLWTSRSMVMDQALSGR